MRQTLLLLFLLAVAALPATAQQRLRFTVESFALDPYDLTAQSEQHRRTDSSGALYAIVKVSSTNPDDDLRDYRFSFGLLKHEVVEHDGELWLYVQRNAKTVTISREGYQTISKYDLKTTIEAGKTYVMQLSASAKPVYMQMVLFRITPADSRAFVTVKKAGSELEETLGMVDDTGRKAKNLPFGRYSYRVMAENYYPSDGMLTLDNQQQTWEEAVTLRPRFAQVTLSVDSDADIYVNGERKGRRTWRGPLNGGTYQVECRQQGHRPSVQTITVEENRPLTLSLIAPTPITGTLSVITEPLGATITIDGRDYGQTPRNISDLVIGSHQLKLSLTGYNSETLTVEVKETEVAEASVTLSNVPKVKPDPLGLCPDDHHPHKIDMGTGILFACCNVGAKSPKDYGDLFAWGETTPKSTYDWSTYKWCRGSKNSMTKYCTDSRYGTVDNKKQLNLADDAARANWGESWRMPTIVELSKLNSECTWTWTTIKGTYGYKVTAKNGNSIFLPSAVSRNDIGLYLASDSHYWSSSLYESYPYGGHELYFISRTRQTLRNDRCDGLSVRPVTEQFKLSKTNSAQAEKTRKEKH